MRLGQLLGVDLRTRAQARGSPAPARSCGRPAPSPPGPSPAPCGSRSACAANGPILRRLAKRSAAATASASACSRALAPSSSSTPAARSFFEHAPFAIAAPGQRLGLGQRIGRVVDIALLGKPVGNSREVGLPRAVPAALADLAREVRTQLRPRRRETADIAQRKLVQLALIEGRQCPARSWPCHDAVFVPQSPTNRKPAATAAGMGVDQQSGRDGVLERNASVKNELAPPGATPTIDPLPRRLADFATVAEALDYTATGRRGLNFHDARGTLVPRLSLFRAARRMRSPTRSASSRSASSLATASR